MDASTTDSMVTPGQTSAAQPKESTVVSQESPSTPKMDEMANEVARRDAIISNLQKQYNQSVKDLKISKQRETKLVKSLTRATEAGFISGETDQEESQAEFASERTRAESLIYKLLISNPSYREVLEQDKTLQKLLLSNPLALVPTFVDAEDAVEQIETELKSRLQELQQNKKADAEAVAVSQTPVSKPITEPTEPIVNPMESGQGNIPKPINPSLDTMLENSIKNKMVRK